MRLILNFKTLVFAYVVRSKSKGTNIKGGGINNLDGIIFQKIVELSRFFIDGL